MPTFSQRSFSGGEIAPSLYARTDVNKYYTSLRTMRNFYTMRHGGAENRPGTQFICEVKDSTKETRLVPFVFSRTVSYVLEFGDLCMRVIKNGVLQTLASQNITAITNANPCVVTYAGSDTYTNGDQVQIAEIIGPIGNFLNSRTFRVANVNTTANTFELQYLDGTNVNSTSFGAYTSGGTVAEIYRLTTPYAHTDLVGLKFAQSGDVLTIVHPSYEPRELSRTGDTSWTLSLLNFDFNVGPNITSATQNGTTGSTVYNYALTAFDVGTGEETLITGTSVVNGNATLSVTNSITIVYTSFASAYDGQYVYNVYRMVNGVYGFIGVGGDTGVFTDIGLPADTTDTPPTLQELFQAVNDYPSCVTFYQQRRVFGNSNNDPEKIWMSRPGLFNNFSKSQPVQEDDTVQFVLAGKLFSRIHHVFDLGRLIVLTESGEWAINGDDSGAVTPTRINAKQYSYNGSDPNLSPIVIGNSALYVQSRGSIIRDLNFQADQDGYGGTDITIFSAHLVDGFKIIDLAYQQAPHSVVWIVRSDGTLLGCTYLKDQQMLAWHRHDTHGGSFVNVCSIPGSQEDDVYVTVERQIDGKSVKYVEKMAVRKKTDIKDITILDSFLSYDGRNTNLSHTMTLSEFSGGGWDYTSTVTITSSTSYFTASDVGNEIQLTGSDGTQIRFELTTFVSGTVMRGKPNKTIPVSMRSASISSWARAVDSLRGLWHLNGQNVSVFADGFVVGNPNNGAYEVVTVTNGQVVLDRPYAVIHVGLPITSDIETLNIDVAQGETLADKKQIVNKVSLFVEASRGIWAGSERPPFELTDFLGGLNEVKLRSFESYDSPVELKTEVVDVDLQSHWNSNGRVFIRQTDPVPLTVLAIFPAGRFPVR